MNLSKFIHLRLQGAPLGVSVFNGGDDQGPLSKLDTNLAVGGVKELDPGRSDLGKTMAILDPMGLPAQGIASGNLGPFGTPTQKGVDNPLAVSGITDVAHNYGAEIAAMIAAGSYFGGGGFGGEDAGAGSASAGDFSAGGGFESEGMLNELSMNADPSPLLDANIGYDPGAEGMYMDPGEYDWTKDPQSTGNIKQNEGLNKTSKGLSPQQLAKLQQMMPKPITPDYAPAVQAPARKVPGNLVPQLATPALSTPANLGRLIAGI